MPYVIDEETGRLVVNGVPVNATMRGGRLDCIIRCPNEATFNAIAESVGMMSRQDDGEGNEVLVANPDVDISRIGPVVITPGVYDDEGNEIAPPVMDNRFHVNYLLGPKAMESGVWESWIVQWMQIGELVGLNNKSESAVSLFSVELIDPMSIQSPKRVWL